MKYILSLFLIIFLMGCAAPHHPEETPAIYAAQVWLQMVDNEQYAASWSNAASFFKGIVSEEEWLKMMNTGRVPFGNTLSRDFKSAKYFSSLPGAPDGDYIVVQFKTSFSHKKNAVETVTPMKETNGEWRVSGYYIK